MVNLNLRIRYFTDTHSWLCFRHAIQRVHLGEDVQTDIDDYDSDYYLGSTSCKLCEEERKEARSRDGK